MLQKIGSILIMCLLIPITTVWAQVDTASATWKLYKVVLYESGDCTGTSQTVLNSTDGETSDFVANPTLGTANIDDGIYNCVAIKMSDAVTFTPSANNGDDCVAGTSYSMYVCPSSSSYYDSDSGATTACTDSEDTMWIYISTYSTSTSGSSGNDAFKPPSSEGDATNGIKLASALIVSGNSTRTFIIDTSNKVQDLGSSCDMDQPAFSFE